MSIYPKDRYGLIRRPAALDAGFSDNELSAAVRSGHLIRLIPGIFAESSQEYRGIEGAQKLHRDRSIAVVTSGLTVRDDLPLSHSSAAAVLGVPLLKPDVTRVHVTTGSAAGGSIRAFRHLHPAPIDGDEITEVRGIAVTCLERLAVDEAVSGSFEQALVAMDQSIRAGADPSKIAAILEKRRRRGVRTARRALEFADGAAQSVGESWSRAQMIEAGLPIPRLQHEFHIGGKTYDSDFDWDELLVGEFDGMHKYGRLLKPGETPEEAVVREKLREDDLRREDSMVVRWHWSMLERRQVVGQLTPWLQRFGLMAA